MAISPRQFGSVFELQFPQSVGIYNSYADAQKAVDFLADAKFEVQNLAIVGTELKSVERVLGRRNWGTVITQGMQSGISTGLLVGLVMLIFTRPASILLLLLVSLAIGVLLGVGFSAAAYAMSRGRRDFTSVTQTIATKYEVLCEHKVAAQAREMLQGGCPGPAPRSLNRSSFASVAQAMPGFPPSADRRHELQPTVAFEAEVERDHDQQHQRPRTMK